MIILNLNTVFVPANSLLFHFSLLSSAHIALLLALQASEARTFSSSHLGAHEWPILLAEAHNACSIMGNYD